MADEETRPEERAFEIPTEFSLREQLEEMQMVYKAKHDFIHGRIAAHKPVAPSKDLALYSLARLKAAGETIRRLYEEERRGRAQQPPAAEPARTERAADEDGWD